MTNRMPHVRLGGRLPSTGAGANAAERQCSLSNRDDGGPCYIQRLVRADHSKIEMRLGAIPALSSLPES